MAGNILVVNVNWVGDVIFSTPFMRALRKKRPDARISCLLHPRCVQMLEGNPNIDEIIIYDEEGVHRSLYGKFRLIRNLRRKRFDTAFILHRSFTKALIAYLAGIGERVGYPTKNRGWVLTKSIEEPDEELHKVDYFLNIAKGCGIEPSGGHYEFFVDESDRKYIREFLKKAGIPEDGRVAVLCPAGNWAPKRWPAPRFAALGDMLAQKLGFNVVISAAAKDASLAEEVRGLMKSPAVAAAGNTDLKQLGALLERAGLVVANDTGPMHIASALGVDTIALFGPTSPGITGPHGGGRYSVIFRNKRCDVPCYELACTHNSCMDAISVEDVFDEAVKLIRR